MRVALVSPYSWTYPGGVNRHVSALARQLTEQGHDPVIFSPYDPDDERARRTHHGMRPAHDARPAHHISLGRTVGIPANGAMSNLAVNRAAALAARRALNEGGFDIAHLHEPVAPAVCWDLMRSSTVPLVGTFHTYSTNDITNGMAAWPLGGRHRMRRLVQRIAVSKAAAWTAHRYYGGRYRIIPNGVDTDSGPLASSLPRLEAPAVLSLVFIGQPVLRKGLPVLIEAFSQLRDRLGQPLTLTLIGPTRHDVASLIDDPRGIVALGDTSESLKRAVLADADVLCAPSLYGESFGMVLTEALASGVPVVASDIPGYRDVVRHGVEGVLVPPGDPNTLARALARLLEEPSRRLRMATAGVIRAQEFAWPKVAAQIVSTYEEALAAAPSRTPSTGAAACRTPGPARRRRLTRVEEGQHRQHPPVIVTRLR